MANYKQHVAIKLTQAKRRIESAQEYYSGEGTDAAIIIRELLIGAGTLLREVQDELN